jgi:hypothetical protein
MYLAANFFKSLLQIVYFCRKEVAHTSEVFYSNSKIYHSFLTIVQETEREH